MYKPLKKSDISVRPFETYKSWIFSNTGSYFVLKDTGSLDEILIETENGSYIELTKKDYVGLKIRDATKPTYNIFYTSESKYFDTNSILINDDGTYQGVEYTRIKHLYYNNYNNPFYLFGLENTEQSVYGDKEIRAQGDKQRIVSIPYIYRGEKIRPGSVIIQDQSYPHDIVTITDDSFTNLKINKYSITNIEKINPYNEISSSYYEPDNNKFGYSVSAYGNYVAVGSPVDDTNITFGDPFGNSVSEFSKKGIVKIAKFNAGENKHQIIKHLYCPFSQEAISTQYPYDNTLLLSTEFEDFLSNNGFSLEDGYGKSVALTDNFLAVAAPDGIYSFSEQTAGFVYVYEKNKGGVDNWGIINILESDVYGDGFGESVALNGDYLIVGAPYTSNNVGAVHIYKRKIYHSNDEKYRLDPENPIHTEEEVNLLQEDNSQLLLDSRESFWSILQDQTFFDGNNILYNTEATYNILSSSYYAVNKMPPWVSGSNTFVYLQTITPPDAYQNMGFGKSVAIHENKIVIGSAGGVHLYGNTFSTTDELWEYKQRFSPTGDFGSDISSIVTFDNIRSVYSMTKRYPGEDGYGHSVDVDKDLVIVGAPSDSIIQRYDGDTSTLQMGAAYIYKISSDLYTQSLLQKIYPNNFDNYDNPFGQCVRINRGSGYAFISSYYNPTSTTVGILTESLQIEIPDYLEGADNPLDTDYIEGKVHIYLISSQDDSISKVTELKRYKLQNDIRTQYGFCIDNSFEHLYVGSPFLAQYSSSWDPFILTSSIFLEKEQTLETGSFSYTESALTTVYTLSSSKGFELTASAQISFTSIGPTLNPSLQTLTYYDFGLVMMNWSDPSQYAVADVPSTMTEEYFEQQYGRFGSASVTDLELKQSFLTTDYPRFTGMISASYLSDNTVIYLLSGSINYTANVAYLLQENTYKLIQNSATAFNYPFYRNYRDFQLNEDNFYVHGNVIAYDLNNFVTDKYVGNVFYTTGELAINLSSSIYENIFNGVGNSGFTLKYKGTHTIFENEVICPIESGEFNVSTNPSAIYKVRPLYDINDDGVFDLVDVEILTKYFKGFKNFNDDLIEDYGFFSDEDPTSDSNILITESEDVLLSETGFNTSISYVSGSLEQNYAIEEYLDNLKNNGYLDLNQDGYTDENDLNLILAFFAGKTDVVYMKQYITETSTRDYNTILNKLYEYTGINNKITIHPNFYNYIESCSIDRSGSYLSPYVTTIGLYDNEQQLVAIAKLGSPIKILQDFPMNFIVRFDN